MKQFVILTISYILLISIFTPGYAEAKDFEVIDKTEGFQKKPAEGKTLVIFFRRYHLMNAGIELLVLDDKQVVEMLPNRKYCFYECQPGKHTFAVAGKPMFDYELSFIHADLKPDHIYYIYVTMGKGGSNAFDDMQMLPAYPDDPEEIYSILPDWFAKKKSLPVTIKQKFLEKRNKKIKSLLRCYTADFRDWRRSSHPKLLPEHGQLKQIQPTLQ